MEAERKASVKTVFTRERDSPTPCALGNRHGVGRLISARPMGTAEVSVGAVTIRIERADYFLPDSSQ